MVSKHRPCGTAAYMAPEVHVGKKIGQKYSDIFSGAVVMVEWFTGSRAWRLDGSGEEIGKIAKRRKKEGRMPDSLKDVPYPVRPLLTRCLSYNTKERPSARRVKEVMASLAGRYC